VDLHVVLSVEKLITLHTQQAVYIFYFTYCWQ